MMLQFLLAYFLIISSRDLKSSSLFLSFRCGDTVAMTQKLVCKIISVMSVWHYQISSFFFQYYVYLLHFFHLLGYLTSEWLHTDLATVRSGLTWTSCSEATQCHERKSPGARYAELPNREYKALVSQFVDFTHFKQNIVPNEPKLDSVSCICL